MEADKEGVQKEIDVIISKNHSKKPLIRIKLTSDAGLDFTAELEAKYSEQALLSFRKDVKEDSVKAKSIAEQRLSVQELGKKLLADNLREQGLDIKTYESVFELLLEKKPDEALRLLREAPAKE
jgi:hypothetical protein